MSKEKVTIYEVAEAAGVGIGTVSRVLNENENVSETTRDKVLKAMQQLNYQPDGMARGLALQKTGSIGVAVPTFTEHFFVEVLKGVQSGLEAADMDLVLFKIEKDEYKQDQINRLLKERKVDGVLAITLDMTKEEIASFDNVGLPVVLVDDYQDQVSSIYVDEKAGVKKAVNHLFELGHQRIAFLDGPLDSKHGQNRLAGVKEAFAEAGLNLPDQLLKTGDFKIGSGYQAMRELIELPKERMPTAVFAASDNQAIGALEAIEEAGLSVPDDFALIGYDDIELAHYLDLTTVSQPMFAMGKSGIELLTKAIKGETEAIIQQEMEPELVIRGSC